MRRILIENARRKGRAKRGGDLNRRDLHDDAATVDPDNADELLSLDEALNKLEADDPQLANLVELRYFTGLTIEETAKVLGVSSRTTKRNWSYTRAWLQREMGIALRACHCSPSTLQTSKHDLARLVRRA